MVKKNAHLPKKKAAKKKSGSGWNHRVLAHAPSAEALKIFSEVDTYFQIHEVYYKDNIPDAYTLEPITVGGDSLADIEWTLLYMLGCLTKPLLWAGDRFPEEYVPEGKHKKSSARTRLVHDAIKKATKKK